MLAIFRRIRRSLLFSGTIRRYTFYAIGEIALVVLGILIALQINNWNENRKSYSVERQMLTEIRNSLVSDLENEIANAISRKESDLKRLSILIDNIENDYPYHDSLTQHFGALTTGDNFEPQISAYKSLESQGLNLLRNEDVKRRIMDIYNIEYPKLSNRVQNKVINIHEYGRPIIRSKFRMIPNEGFMPLDYKSLKNDVEYWNILQTLKSNNTALLRMAKELKEKVEILVKLIDQELINEM